MLSIEQYKIINEQLSKENAARQLEIKQKRLNQYSWEIGSSRVRL